MSTVFSPKTKYEIRDCQWYSLELLPSSKKDPIPDSLPLKYNSLYMVMLLFFFVFNNLSQIIYAV